ISTLSLHDALPIWRCQVFITCGSRDGRFMHVEFFGDFAEHERPQGDIAIVEECLLSGNNGLSDSQNRGVALFETTYQPARFLQGLGHQAALLVAAFLEQSRVGAVQLSTWNGVVVW